MPLPDDTGYAKRVVKAYAASPERMGNFPLPDIDVVIAAEVLKQHINQGAYSHAVEVAQVGAGFTREFVFANSGAPGALNVDVDAATEALRRRLGDRSSFVQIKTPFDFYEPAHRDVHALMQSVRADFDGDQKLVRLLDVQQAIGGLDTALANPSQGPTYDTMHPKQQQHWQKSIGLVQHTGQSNQQIVDHMTFIKGALRDPKLGKPQQDAIKRLLAAAAALRLRVVVGTDRAAVRTALTLKANRIAEQTVRPWYAAIGGHLKALLATAPAEINNSTLPPVPFKAFQSAVDEIFRALAQSRYCAEPRVFAAIRQGKLSADTLISQACFWYVGQDGTPNPGEYQVIGPIDAPDDAARSGSYMWACSSCKQRSASMVGGIKTGDSQPRYSRDF